MSHSVTVQRLSQGQWVTVAGTAVRPRELVRFLAQNTTFGKVTFTLRRASGPLGPEIMFTRATQPAPTGGDAFVDVEMPHQEGVYVLDVANDLFWISAEHWVSVILTVRASAPPPPAAPPPEGQELPVPILGGVLEGFQGVGGGVKTLAVLAIVGAIAVAYVGRKK